jgi:hypothetical protein
MKNWQFDLLYERITRMEITLMSTLAQLQAAVTRTEEVEQSAVTLIEGLVEQIKQAGVDQAALDALTNELQAKADAFGAAVAANTPAPAPVPAPPPVQTTPLPPIDPTPSAPVTTPVVD